MVLIGFGIDIYVDEIIKDYVPPKNNIDSTESKTSESITTSLQDSDFRIIDLSAITKIIGNDSLFENVIIYNEETIYKTDFPGVSGYRLPTEEDIEKGTDWHHYMYEAGNDIEKGYLPYTMNVDLNNDGLMDKACILINKDNKDKGKVCLYMKLPGDQFRKYEIDEEFNPTSTFIFFISKGDYMCEWKGNVENVKGRKYLWNNGICISKYESSFSMIIEYEKSKDKFIYGWACYH